VGHITAFLSRFANPLPPAIANLLENWQGGASASVSFERVLIVRAMSSDIMDRIVNTPETRRFLGARLGELAAIIRAEQADGLRETLNEMGIQVEGLN
jgi:exopolysaccharide biosynthesis protein